MVCEGTQAGGGGHRTGEGPGRDTGSGAEGAKQGRGKGTGRWRPWLLGGCEWGQAGSALLLPRHPGCSCRVTCSLGPLNPSPGPCCPGPGPRLQVWPTSLVGSCDLAFGCIQTPGVSLGPAPHARHMESGWAGLGAGCSWDVSSAWRQREQGGPLSLECGGSSGSSPRASCYRWEGVGIEGSAFGLTLKHPYQVWPRPSVCP